MTEQKSGGGLLRRWFGLKRDRAPESEVPENEATETEATETEAREVEPAQAESAEPELSELQALEPEESPAEAPELDHALTADHSELSLETTPSQVQDAYPPATEAETPLLSPVEPELERPVDDHLSPVATSTEMTGLSAEEERGEPTLLTAEAAASEAAPKRNWFQRLTEGLRKSSQSLSTGITDIFTKRKLDDDTLQELEDILIQADLGVDAAARITERVAAGRYNKQIDPAEVKRILAAEVAEVLSPVAQPLTIDASKKPFVIMMVGVNGTGKTTTIGKLAAQFRNEGRRVVLAAGDTFRAAAVEQIKVWGDRVGASVISKDIGADAAGLAYEALQKARAEKADILMIDTAGRLQNKSDLMAELQKITRVLRKQDESAPHAVLLVLDATTGQNAVSQVEIFQKVAGVTGLIMTKLDGTARGGILVAVAQKFRLPVHAIGVGEGVADLQPFAADEFARSIAGLE
ncbi:signal recognition particle-docking protein FtsY [Rhodoligotrophos ferricapiens]|uniref:signal recognition particle-docking protein FtsY n=1 Tax=Rhodoligotrophos ferricapiens TaxID=3069264 RepID=UPI00315DD3D9